MVFIALQIFATADRCQFRESGIRDDSVKIHGFNSRHECGADRRENEKTWYFSRPTWFSALDVGTRTRSPNRTALQRLRSYIVLPWSGEILLFYGGERQINEVIPNATKSNPKAGKQTTLVQKATTTADS
jgi:hypothetical protein